MRRTEDSKYLLMDTSSLMPLRRRVFTMKSRANACTFDGTALLN